MADLRLTRPQSSLSLLLIFKREKREGDAVILKNLQHQVFQFAVTSLQFRVAGISNLSKAFIVQCRHVVFRKFKVLRFFRQNNPLLRGQKSKQHITGGYRKLIRAFKRKAVQFLEAKKTLAVSHLPLKALPAIQK